jgi:hypothetical protein
VRSFGFFITYFRLFPDERYDNAFLLHKCILPALKG